MSTGDGDKGCYSGASESDCNDDDSVDVQAKITEAKLRWSSMVKHNLAVLKRNLVGRA